MKKYVGGDDGLNIKVDSSYVNCKIHGCQRATFSTVESGRVIDKASLPASVTPYQLFLIFSIRKVFKTPL